MENQAEATGGAVEEKTFQVGFSLMTMREGVIEVIANSAEEAVKMIAGADSDEYFCALVEAEGELLDWHVYVDKDEAVTVELRDAFHKYELTNPPPSDQ
jgi:hypothetical protein